MASAKIKTAGVVLFLKAFATPVVIVENEACTAFSISANVRTELDDLNFVWEPVPEVVAATNAVRIAALGVGQPHRDHLVQY